MSKQGPEAFNADRFQSAEKRYLMDEFQLNENTDIVQLALNPIVYLGSLKNLMQLAHRIHPLGISIQYTSVVSR